MNTIASSSISTPSLSRSSSIRLAFTKAKSNTSSAGNQSVKANSSEKETVRETLKILLRYFPGLRDVEILFDSKADGPYYMQFDEQGNKRMRIIIPETTHGKSLLGDRAGDEFVIEELAKVLGMSPEQLKSNRLLLLTLALFHEFGHALDLSTQYNTSRELEMARKSYDNLPGGGHDLTEYNEMHPDATPEERQAFVRAYRQVPMEHTADLFAAYMLRKDKDLRRLFPEIPPLEQAPLEMQQEAQRIFSDFQMSNNIIPFIRRHSTQKALADRVISSPQ